MLRSFDQFGMWLVFGFFFFSYSHPVAVAVFFLTHILLLLFSTHTVVHFSLLLFLALAVHFSLLLFSLTHCCSLFTVALALAVALYSQ